MADIQAFRGLRYDLGKVGSLSEVVAPPYDVIDASMQDELYDRNPHNIVRLILNRGDDLLEGQSIYARAAEHLKKWIRDGALKQDNEGTVYVYHQTFEYEGMQYIRRGFMSRVRIEPFGEGQIYPHEKTHSKVKEDRFKLMEACRSNLSQIFGIYPDPENEAQEILEAAIEDRTPLTAIDSNGVKHEMWLVTNTDAVSTATQILGPKPIYVADGHHRYETATNIRNAFREQDELGANTPCDYVMMMCVSMHDPGMAILPTHRLFRGVESISSAELISKLEDAFDCEGIGNGAELAKDVWENIVVEDQQGTMGFYCRQDDAWVLARVTDAGRNEMAKCSKGQSERWQSLGVSLLHGLVMDKLLAAGQLPTPKYVHSIEEVVEGIRDGDDSGRDPSGQVGSGAHFELACLVMPATVEDVKIISELGERMPAKSTYFYPKLLSGLVINPLD